MPLTTERQQNMTYAAMHRQANRVLCGQCVYHKVVHVIICVVNF